MEGTRRQRLSPLPPAGEVGAKRRVRVALHEPLTLHPNPLPQKREREHTDITALERSHKDRYGNP
jgi:hypothetical protein